MTHPLVTEFTTNIAISRPAFVLIPQQLSVAWHKLVGRSDMMIGKRSSLAAIAASGFALLALQIAPALGQAPAAGASTCTLSAPATARPAGPIQVAWKTTNQPTSASAAMDGAAIASPLPLERGSISVPAPERYGTHLLSLTVANARGSSTCTAEIFVATQTTVAPPPNTFTWVYSSKETGFTDEEIRYLAENYSYIVLTRQHGGFNIDRRHIDARKIKALNPNIKLFSYYSMTSRFRKESVGDRLHPPVFRRAWLLRDAEQGREIPFTYKARTVGEYIDIANPHYRAWLQATLRKWLKAAPYDGIAFDNSIPITDAKHRRHELRRVSLSADTITRYNNALREILSETKQLRPQKGDRSIVIFNGIAPTASRSNRSLDLLKFADMALNEQFCIAPRGGRFLTRDQLKEDIDLMAAADANVQQFVKYRRVNKGGSLQQAARFCYGVFMMGYQPGSDFFRFRDDTRKEPQETRYQNRIYGNAAEVRINLGDPTAGYVEGEVWTRKFQRGAVYVNPDATPHTTILDRDAVLMNGNKIGDKFKSGASVTVPPRDALFFAYDASSAESGSTSKQ